jgi:hypothetical protein
MICIPKKECPICKEKKICIVSSMCKSCSNRKRKGTYKMPSLSKKMMGALNRMWKGKNAGYEALHIYINSHKPKPELCECCKKVSGYDWANISGNYKRDFNDWEWLCRKCHMIKDGRLVKLIKYDKWKKHKNLL